MEKEIQKYRDHIKELENELSSPEVISDPQKFQTLNREYSAVKEIVDTANELENIQKAISDAHYAINTADDAEFKEMAENELEELLKKEKNISNDLKELISPADPLGKRNIIVEIRAGTGGDEAASFAYNLFRMYSRFAERKEWKLSIVSANKTDIGGFKEVVFSIKGAGAYSALKYEIGVHRVQRIPETEKSGRVHTSTATVAVLPEAKEVDIKIDPKDLKIDAMTAGGHGGQSVNTTYSAIRITHLPTNLVIICQDERSQKQNKLKAMEVLRSRLFAAKQEEISKERDDKRRSQIGTGERAEKIRTYNFPQDRVTDHRINQNFHNITQIMDGNMDEIIQELQKTEKGE